MDQEAEPEAEDLEGEEKGTDDDRWHSCKDCGCEIDRMFEETFPFSVVVLGVVFFVVFLGVMSWQAGMGVSGVAVGASLALCGWNMGKIYERRESRVETMEIRAELRELRSLQRDKVSQLAKPTDVRFLRDVVWLAENVANSARIKDPDADDPKFEVSQDDMMALEDGLTALRKWQ